MSGLDVHLYQEAPCRQWIVELRKLGARVSLGAWPADVRGPAEARAREVATFLGARLTIDGETGGEGVA